MLDSKKSVIIIGGGLGGLFTGAILAKNDVEVTIIEKNYSIGGGLQTFVRFGEIYDTGMHLLGGVHEGNNIRRLCDYLGVYDETLFRDCDSQCTDTIYVASDGMTYRIAANKEGFVPSLCRYFPDQRENLNRYVDAMYAITDEMPLFHLHPEREEQRHNEDFLLPTCDFIAKYITDAKLGGILSYLSMLYSGERETPAYIHAVIFVSYLTGPSRFVGGSHRFAELLEKVITENGGQIILNDAVTRIHLSSPTGLQGKKLGRKINSVETRQGRRLSADTYISDIHPCALLGLFEDPSAFPKSFRDRMTAAPNTYSAFTVNLKFHQGTFRYLNHTGFYLNDYDSTWELGNVLTAESSGTPSDKWPLGFLYMTPPETDQGKYSTKMIITAPMSWKYVKQWEGTTLGQRTKDYQFWKKKCLDAILDKLQDILPGIENCIEGINTASPLTIRDYYGTKEGAMCGLRKDCGNMALTQLSVRTKVRNLLLTGQNVSLHGFVGVPLTAIQTCEEILGQNSVFENL